MEYWTALGRLFKSDHHRIRSLKTLSNQLQHGLKHSKAEPALTSLREIFTASDKALLNQIIQSADLPDQIIVFILTVCFPDKSNRPQGRTDVTDVRSSAAKFLEAALEYHVFFEAFHRNNGLAVLHSALCDYSSIFPMDPREIIWRHDVASALITQECLLRLLLKYFTVDMVRTGLLLDATHHVSLDQPIYIQEPPRINYCPSNLENISELALSFCGTDCEWPDCAADHFTESGGVTLMFQLFFNLHRTDPPQTAWKLENGLNFDQLCIAIRRRVLEILAKLVVTSQMARTTVVMFFVPKFESCDWGQLALIQILVDDLPRDFTSNSPTTKASTSKTGFAELTLQILSNCVGPRRFSFSKPSERQTGAFHQLIDCLRRSNFVILITDLLRFGLDPAVLAGNSDMDPKCCTCHVYTYHDFARLVCRILRGLTGNPSCRQLLQKLSSEKNCVKILMGWLATMSAKSAAGRRNSEIEDKVIYEADQFVTDMSNGNNRAYGELGPKSKHHSLSSNLFWREIQTNHREPLHDRGTLEQVGTFRYETSSADWEFQQWDAQNLLNGYDPGNRYKYDALADSVSFLGADQKHVIFGGKGIIMYDISQSYLSPILAVDECHTECRIGHISASSRWPDFFLTSCLRTVKSGHDDSQEASCCSLWKFSGSNSYVVQQYHNTEALEMSNWNDTLAVGIDFNSNISYRSSEMSWGSILPFTFDLEHGIRLVTLVNPSRKYDLIPWCAQLNSSVPSSSSMHSYAVSYSHPHFSPTDELISFGGALYDPRTGHLVHEFDHLRSSSDAVFHPTGNQIVIDSEVMDLRNYKLVVSLEGCQCRQKIFGEDGTILYASCGLPARYSSGHAVPGEEHCNFCPYESLAALDGKTYQLLGETKMISSAHPGHYTSMAVDGRHQYVVCGETGNRQDPSPGRMFRT